MSRMCYEKSMGLKYVSSMKYVPKSRHRDTWSTPTLKKYSFLKFDYCVGEIVFSRGCLDHNLR